VKAPTFLVSCALLAALSRLHGHPGGRSEPSVGRLERSGRYRWLDRSGGSGATGRVDRRTASATLPRRRASWRLSDGQFTNAVADLFPGMTLPMSHARSRQGEFVNMADKLP